MISQFLTLTASSILLLLIVDHAFRLMQLALTDTLTDTSPVTKKSKNG